MADRKRRLWSDRRRIDGPAVRVQVSMSEAERAHLLALEQRTGKSPSALMVEGLFRHEDPEAVAVRKQQLVELLHMRRLMATIANNTNQIAKHANMTGGEVLPEAAQTLREARVFGEQVLAKVEELGR